MNTAKGTLNLRLNSLPSRDVMEGPPGITDNFLSNFPQVDAKKSTLVSRGIDKGDLFIRNFTDDFCFLSRSNFWATF